MILVYGLIYGLFCCFMVVIVGLCRRRIPIFWNPSLMVLLYLLYLLSIDSLVCVWVVCDQLLSNLCFSLCRKRNEWCFWFERFSYRHRCRWRQTFRGCVRWWEFKSWFDWSWWLCWLVGLGCVFCVCALFGKSYYSLKLLG